MSMDVLKGGVLSLLQDNGRIGYHRLGMTTGGPLDGEAYRLCNALLGNSPGSTLVEVSAGGLRLRAGVDTFCCLTGAPMQLTIDGEAYAAWEVHSVKAGQEIDIGFAAAGCRAYFGVARGFCIEQSFGSAATVTREGIGGLNGSALQAGDTLPCPAVTSCQRLRLPENQQPRYQRNLTVRVVPGYQQALFNREQQRLFFSQPYTVSERSDRMGYRLEGIPVECATRELLSEGICYGAIQLPADGQPIVLLNDRQTIGGYPKIGTALSVDAQRLSQLVPGSTVHFAPITVGTAQKVLELQRRFDPARALVSC